MDKYRKWQFNSMRNRFLKEKYGKKYHKKSDKVKNWVELYKKMRKDLEKLKKQNKLQDERIRVMSILEHAEQRKVNIGIEKAMPLVSLIFSTAIGIVSVYYSNRLIQTLQEKFVDNITQEEFVNNLTPEGFKNIVEQIGELLTRFSEKLWILAITLAIIAVVYGVCLCICNTKQNDIVYYKTKLNIIDMLLAENTEK